LYSLPIPSHLSAADGPVNNMGLSKIMVRGQLGYFPQDGTTDQILVLILHHLLPSSSLSILHTPQLITSSFIFFILNFYSFSFIILLSSSLFFEGKRDRRKKRKKEEEDEGSTNK
jgi:hypothetical protein